MFEYHIQKAWENYKQDFGLGRLLIFQSFINLFFFFISFAFFNGPDGLALFPVVLSLVILFFRPAILRSNDLVKTLSIVTPVGVSIILNYYLMGEFDRSVGGLPRQDALFHAFDMALFSKPVSFFYETTLGNIGLLGTLLYDFMMISYMLFYVFPLAATAVYYISLPSHERYRMGRLFFSVSLFFAINYLLFLLVPVTGPQYWLEDLYTSPLPLSAFGKKLWTIVFLGQTTFIDCFPSGHTGMTFLVTIWVYRINHPARHLFAAACLLIINATLALRYHYTMDLVAAFILALFCHRAAWLLIPVNIKAPYTSAKK
jgi:membrane-associated phospholipid phosphatase